jgi:chromosome segregation ATPase
MCPFGVHDDMPEVDEVLSALNDAQRRAAEQRLAAERLLEEARALEARLAEQIEHARTANEHLEKARELERAAAEAAENTSAQYRQCVHDRTQAEAEANGAREELERTTARSDEANRRLEAARAAEETARIEAASAIEHLRERREAREQIEAEFRAAQDRGKVFNGTVESLASIEELRAREAGSAFQNEAARRAAERRAADAARAATR